MIKIRENICTGCGRCAHSCPTQAISIVNRVAKINERLCKGCGLCLSACPQGAVIEIEEISKAEMEKTITSLKQKTDTIIERLEKMKR